VNFISELIPERALTTFIPVNRSFTQGTLYTQWRCNEFESVGDMSGAKRQKIVDVPSTLGSKSTMSRFGERFCDGQSVQFNQFLFCCSSTHGAPRAQPFVKLGARGPVLRGVDATGYRYQASILLTIYVMLCYVNDKKVMNCRLQQPAIENIDDTIQQS